MDTVERWAAGRRYKIGWYCPADDLGLSGGATFTQWCDRGAPHLQEHVFDLVYSVAVGGSSAAAKWVIPPSTGGGVQLLLGAHFVGSIFRDVYPIEGALDGMEIRFISISVWRSASQSPFPFAFSFHHGQKQRPSLWAKNVEEKSRAPTASATPTLPRYVPVVAWRG